MGIRRCVTTTTCRRGRRTAWAAGLLAALAAAAAADFLLPDPGSKVWYRYALVAGEKLQVVGATSVTGNLHSNGTVDLQSGSVVTGDVTAVGSLTLHGTVNGATQSGAPAVTLPALPSAAELRALADRVIEGNTELANAVVDDVLFVAGDVRVTGTLSGAGAILAEGDIRLEELADGPVPAPDPASRLALVALRDVRIDKNRPFRGALRAGRDVDLQKSLRFDGVAIAGRNLSADKDSQIRFVKLDVAAPVVTIVAPPAGGFVTSALPAIEATYTDDLSGVDLTTVRLLLDGADVTAGAQVGPGGVRFTPTTPLAEGQHAVEARAADVAGNLGTATATFTVDTAGPTVAITAPPAQVVGDETPAITVTYSDATSGVDPATLVVRLDGNPLAGCAVGPGQASCEPPPLTEGIHTVTAAVRDRAGNNGSASHAFELVLRRDNEPPVVEILEPAGGGFVLEARAPIRVRYEDDSGIDLASLALTVNGSPLAAACDTAPDEARCVPDAALPDGDVTLVASIADRFANRGSASVEFAVDSVPLEISVTAPEDGAVTRDVEVVVSGTVGLGVAAVEVNGVPAPLSFGAFSATVPLRQGTNTLVALATKTNGRTGTATVQVVRDEIAPIVRIDSPRDGFVAPNPAVAVTGLVNDLVHGGAEATVVVNGVTAQVSGGAFLVEELPLVRGPNTIEAVATDRVGNTGRHTINVLFQEPVGARIAMADGNGQSGLVRSALPQPLVAVVEDELGNPLAGRLVRFQVTRNNGTVRVSPSAEPERLLQVPTDGAGRAAAWFTLGDTSGQGTNRVVASALGVTGEVEFCATGLAAAPDKVLMTAGDNQRGGVGQPLPMPLEALVVDKDGNPIEGVEVAFEVVKGTGTLDGQTRLLRHTGIDGLVRAVLTLGVQPGINNNVVAATFEGFAGLPATFTASALTPGDPAETRFSGVVLDNAHTPIPGATVRIDGTSVESLTGAQGEFLLTGVPVGHVHLIVDPRLSPRPEVFPPLAFETVTVAGQENILGQPILIPALDLSESQIVGGPQDVTIKMPGVPGLELTVFANSATFRDGARTGRVSITQVHLDKVPMPPPSGTFFMPPAWTVQPAGVAFDPPARIQIPNDGMPAGRMIDIFQFDHDLNQFVNVGKGTTTEDGLAIVSDPGFGITHAGWGGCGQPQPPDTCTCQCDDGNECTRDICTGQPLCLCFYEKLTNSTCCDGVKFDPATQGCCDEEDIFTKKTQCCADDEVVPKKPIPFGDLLDCTERFQCPTWKRQYDGCSLPASPGFDKDNPAGGADTQFAICAGQATCPNPRACDTHDECYQTCYPGGSGALIVAKAGCDVGMYQDMRATCAASQAGFFTRKRCFDFADIYYAGLRLGGDYAFLSRQYNDVCQCCP